MMNICKLKELKQVFKENVNRNNVCKCGSVQRGRIGYWVLRWLLSEL